MKRIVLFIFAFILGVFVATNAFCQPVQEIDPRSIWKDGSKTTTAVIPFAEGLSVPAGKSIYFGDTHAYLNVEAPYGSVNFNLEAASSWKVLQFNVNDPTGYIRFSDSAGNSTTYESSGITHTLAFGAGLSVADGVGNGLFNIYNHAVSPAIYSFVPLKVNPLTNNANQFQVTNSSYTSIFNVDVSTPAITNSAKTNIAVTNANAFLVENASGTDRFLVDTNTPKIDLLANTNLGASGTGYDFTAWSATASKALRWQPNASSVNPVLLFDILSGRGKQIEISGTDTIIGSANTYVNVDVTNQWTGAQNIAALFQFYYRDKRTITSSSAEFKRVLDFYFERGASGSFTSNQTTHTVEVAQFTLTDAGTYSRAAGITNELTGMNFNYNNVLPTIQATSGSGTYNFTTFLIDGTISGNGNGFTTSTQTAFDWQPTYQQFPGFIGFLSATQIGMYLRPTNNVAGGTASAMYGVRYAPTISGTTPATEYALHASRSGIGLIADGSSSDVGSSGGAGGGLIMGASSDWKRYYEADNEAVEDIPTGAVYDWRINAVDQVSLGLRALTLGDNTSNDFSITVNQGNDATVHWDNTDKSWYFETNGASEFVYPTYGAGYVINDRNITAGTSRFATQFWATAASSADATSEVGAFWGGYHDSGASTPSLSGIYGLVPFNYFAGTNARTYTTVWGLYAGNEFDAVTQITATDIYGAFIDPFATGGSGSIATATNIYGLSILGPTATATGGVTNWYSLRIAASSLATNNYGIFLNGAVPLTFRAGTQSIWSSAASTLDLTFNTTWNIKLGANPANGTAGSIIGVYNASGLSIGATSANVAALEIPAYLNSKRIFASWTGSADSGLAGTWGGLTMSITNTRATNGGAGTGNSITMTTSQPNSNHTVYTGTINAASQTTGTSRVLNGSVTMSTGSATTGQAQGGFLQLSAPQSGAAAGYILGLGRGATGTASNPAGGDLVAIRANYLSNDTSGAAYGLHMIKGATVPTTAYAVYGFGDYFTVDDNTWSIGTSANAFKQIYASTDINIETGTSGVFAETGGAVTQNTTAVGNVGTGEDDLITYSVSANTLATDGERIDWKAAGTLAASANNKRIRCYFGSDTLIDTTSLAITGATDWEAHGTIIRTGATTQKASTVLTSSDALLVSKTDYTTPGRTLSSANTLKCTGEATSNDDVKQEFLVVDWMPSN